MASNQLCEFNRCREVKDEELYDKTDSEVPQKQEQSR
jgi:hypothetical protein